jgi:hypothetical protein
MMTVLEKLFGSPARVKIIRLFLLNPENLFNLKEISRRAKVNIALSRREISLLSGIEFIKQKTEKIDEIIKLKNGTIKNKKKRINGFKLNLLFPFLHQLRNLVVTAAPINKEKFIKNLNSTGKIKVIITSGIFMQSEESKIDLLIVGDSIRRGALDRILKNIEADIGKELNYAIFTTEEFLYRFGMYDRFIRDIIDYPHEKLVNKLNI